MSVSLIHAERLETLAAKRIASLPEVSAPAPAALPLARTDVPLGMAIACLILVALSLRPGIVSVGPVLTDMIDAFGLSHTQASLLTAIPTLLMGLLALPTPWR